MTSAIPSKSSSRPLENRVAVVTGAASGIGNAVARRFLAEGARVVLVDRNPPPPSPESSAPALETPRQLSLMADVTRSGECDAAIAATLEAFGRLDILCNAAGVIFRGTALETGDEDWKRVLAVNATGTFYMSRAAARAMVPYGAGVIVNVASGWGIAGGARAVAYCASKGAVVQLTRAMAIDHGPQGIRVVCLCPGDTDTPMLRNEASMSGESLEAFLANAARRPLGRVGTPAEVAAAALFLASDAAAFITGTILVVDGGGLAGS